MVRLKGISVMWICLLSCPQTLLHVDFFMERASSPTSSYKHYVSVK